MHVSRYSSVGTDNGHVRVWHTRRIQTSSDRTQQTYYTHVIPVNLDSQPLKNGRLGRHALEDLRL